MTPTRHRVLVVGDVIDDIQVKLQQSPRPDTDTPAEIRRNPGGSAANTAAWLAHDGVLVDFWGRVGAKDADRIATEFANLGVDPHLQSDDVRETGTIVMMVQGETRTMLSDRGANVGVDLDSLPDALLGTAAWLHLTGYAVFHHTDPDSIPRLISRARTAGVSVMLDASSAGFLEDQGPRKFLDYVAGVNCLRCNKDEALVLAGTDDAEQALLALGRLFPVVVMTEGAAGSWLCEGGVITRIQAVSPEHLVDPTGAGDAYNAGLLAGLLQGLSLVQAAEKAAALAAKAVTKWGARP
jgi:sugar/nucleoside kinase (ribokinase family)